MEKFVIKGGRELRGKVRISGSKNASLPILFTSILTDRLELDNTPELKDVETALKLLKQLGLSVRRSGKRVVVEKEGKLKPEAPFDLVRTMRASILALGPLLARLGRARVALPGGCAIGARPVNLHLKALSKM